FMNGELEDSSANFMIRSRPRNSGEAPVGVVKHNKETGRTTSNNLSSGPDVVDTSNNFQGTDGSLGTVFCN
ncbi:hypothetical protein C5167_034481, partial [Papaver somniferum]